MNETEQTSILIVDDHAVVRQGLRTFLELQTDLVVVGEADNGQTAVALTKELTPDVVLMDLVMPQMDGIEATRRIRAISPQTQVLVLTSFTEDEKVFPAIKAGALSYLLKDVAPAELVRAVQAAARGEAQLHPEIAQKLMREVVGKPKTPTVADLTERETEVLSLIARGLPNQEIATTLTISHKTVKTHVSNILSKLHLADRTQAAIYALQKGVTNF